MSMFAKLGFLSDLITLRHTSHALLELSYHICSKTSRTAIDSLLFRHHARHRTVDTLGFDLIIQVDS